MGIARFVYSSLVYALWRVLSNHISNVPQTSSPRGQPTACRRRSSYRPFWRIKRAVSNWSNLWHLKLRLLAEFLCHLWQVFTKLCVKRGSLHSRQALIAFHSSLSSILGLLWRCISVKSNSLTLINLCWYLLEEFISNSTRSMNLLRNINDLLWVVSYSELHEFWHFFISHYWLRILEPIFAHKLSIQEVVHRSNFFKELFIV